MPPPAQRKKWLVREQYIFECVAMCESVYVMTGSHHKDKICVASNEVYMVKELLPCCRAVLTGAVASFF